MGGDGESSRHPRLECVRPVTGRVAAAAVCRGQRLLQRGVALLLAHQSGPVLGTDGYNGLSGELYS
jgi:hypothetical protein